MNYTEAEELEQHLGGFELLIALAHDPKLNDMLCVEVIETIYVLTGDLL